MVSSTVFGANNWFKGIFRAAKAEIYSSSHAIDSAGFAFLAVRFERGSFTEVYEFVLIQATLGSFGGVCALGNSTPACN